MILGASGMLGSSLLRHFSKSKAFQVIGIVRSNEAKQHLEQQGFTSVLPVPDVLNEATVGRLMETERPDILLNAIGLIKHASTSRDPCALIEINSLLPHKLARCCSKAEAKLIHFSTDCVFSGGAGNYKEEDLADATDLYGRSKFLGEVAYDGHLTLRTSLIGHELRSNINLIDWFLSQSVAVDGYSNAIFSGVPTCYMAKILEDHILPLPTLSGLYHLSAEPISKYDLLCLVQREYGTDLTINDYPDIRVNRSLNSDKLRAVIDFTPLCWPELIKKMHDDYVTYFA